MSDTDAAAAPEPADATAAAPMAAEPVSDEMLDAVSGGQMDNSTEIVFASTFVPFDSSF